MSALLWRHRKVFEKVSIPKKAGSLIVSNISGGKGILLLWNGFVFHVRGLRCVQNEVLSTYGRSALCSKSGPIALNWRKKLATLRVVLFLRKRRITRAYLNHAPFLFSIHWKNVKLEACDKKRLYILISIKLSAFSICTKIIAPKNCTYVNGYNYYNIVHIYCATI